jgi:hypothetical protein
MGAISMWRSLGISFPGHNDTKKMMIIDDSIVLFRLR